jgi:anti-anti-sigma regulatory factor
MPPSTARLRIEAGLSILHRPTHTIVTSRGDIDTATAPVLRERLLGMLGAGMRLLILGLSRMSLCDVAGPTVCTEYPGRVPGPWRGRP